MLEKDAMPTPSVPASEKPFCPIERIKPYLVPYYFTVAAVLGAITAVFVAIFAVLVLVVTNFNILSLIE